MSTIYWPFDPGIINYGYGYPPGYGGYHNGIDFPVPQSTPLIATASGTIRNVDAGKVDGAGVDIMTPDGWKVRMWHVSAFLVPHGSQVEAGQIVALSGGARGTWGAGNSTGAHLHWGIATNGRDGWVDPAGLNPQPYAPTPPNPPKKKRQPLATVYYTKDNNGHLWAVADGAAVGTPAAWIDTRNQDEASGWARAFHLNEQAVTVDTTEWGRLRKIYLEG